MHTYNMRPINLYVSEESAGSTECSESPNRVTSAILGIDR